MPLKMRLVFKYGHKVQMHHKRNGMVCEDVEKCPVTHLCVVVSVHGATRLLQ